MEKLIEIDRLSAAYDGHTVLHDVCLDIHERDFLGIIGPNGGGKTTLVRCILGLLKPTDGTITRRPGLRMGYLPQYTTIDRRFPITVNEVVLSGLDGTRPVTSRYTASQRAKADEVMQRMGLEGMGSRPIGSLSGGQLQRALLGRAIVSDPHLVILDEPSTYIDQEYQSRLYRLLAELNHTCAIVLVSHDIGTVLQQVKSIACVNRTLDYHPDTGITPQWLEHHFHCPIELLAHGDLPHRILGRHQHE